MRAAHEVHQFQRQLLELHAREPQLLQAQTQVRGVLHVERQLRAGEQDQPAEIRPQQRRHHERESRVHDGEASGVHDERGEHFADGGPQDAGRQRPDERRTPLHARVGNQHVHGGEERRDHHVGRQTDARAAQTVQQRQVHHLLHRRAAQGRVRQPHEAHEQHRAGDEQAGVLREPPCKTARLVHVPQEVEAVLDLLDGAHQGPGEQRQSHRPHYAAADVAGELHHARGELGRRRAADRAKELVDDRFQVAVPAEALEYGETEGEQRDDRQQRRVHQAHGAQVDFPAPQVTHHRIRVAQHAQTPPEHAGAHRGRSEEAPVEKGLDAHPHGLRIQCSTL